MPENKFKLSSILSGAVLAGVILAGLVFLTKNQSKTSSIKIALPEIFDRNGELLVTNRNDRKERENPRIYTKGGTFASTLIGHIQYFNSSRRQVSFKGSSGVEQIITRKDIRHPVYLTIDSKLQVQLEKLISCIAIQSDPLYAYGIIVNSKGELIAAAQSSVLDLEKRICIRRNPSAHRTEMIFLPAEYLLPIPDQWMKLLNSASNAKPQDKVKLQFHKKQGVFPNEAPGKILGLGDSIPRPPHQTAGQMATMLNYVHAYIGIAEKKEIPKLSVYTDKINTPVLLKGDVRWISFYRPPDGIVVNALGVIQTEKPEEKLYVCIRSVNAKRNYLSPLKKEVSTVISQKVDKAEESIRNFSFFSEKNTENRQKNMSDALMNIVDACAPDAAQILLYDIKANKITASAAAGEKMPKFKPFSFMKPFTITAALRAGTVKMTDVIDCGNGICNIGPRRIMDPKGFGKITVAGILQNRSNIGTWKIARTLKPEELQKFAGEAGFKTLPNLKKEEDFAAYAIGINFRISPEKLLSVWANLLKYPETTAAISHPFTSSTYLVTPRKNGYVSSAIGYTPEKNPQYVLLLTVSGNGRKMNSIQRGEILRKQWLELEAQLNKSIKSNKTTEAK